MRSLFLSFILIFFIGIFAHAQQLYMPRNIQIAVEKGTRSMDGNPGKNYWQNEGKYDINVTLTPETKTVSGVEKIVYSNNSPDTLRMIAIRFVNNFHKPLAPRGGYTNPDILTSGLDIESFSIDNEAYQIDSKNWGTVAAIRLKKAILPRTSVTIDVSWNYPLSKQSGREGQIDSTTFFVA